MDVVRLRVRPDSVGPLRLDEGAVGQRGADARTGRRGDATAAEFGRVAVPLLHEGRLVGGLVIRTGRTGLTFSNEDVESLEMLAGVAAAAMVGLERAQLVAVTLAARELAHVLNNDLALPVGALELLNEDPALPPHLRQIVGGAGGADRRLDTSSGCSRWSGSRRRRRPVARPWTWTGRPARGSAAVSCRSHTNSGRWGRSPGHFHVILRTAKQCEGSRGVSP